MTWGMLSHSSPDEQPGSTTQRSIGEVRAAVVQAVANIERGERNALEGLRQALCTFVVALRDDGASRDEALEAARVVIETRATPNGALALLPSARDALVELSTHWCEEAYGK